MTKLFRRFIPLFGLLSIASSSSALTPPPQTYVLDFGVSGPSAFVTAPASPAVEPGSQLTIEFWIFLEGASPGKVLINRRLDQPPWFLYQVAMDPSAGTNVVFYQNSTTKGTGTAPAPIPLRNWTHVAATLSGTAITLMINGHVVSSVPSAGPLPAVSSHPFEIGGGGALASMRQLRIWSRALTPAEVQSGAGAVGPNSPGLVAFWPMDDGSGPTVRDVGPNHADIQMGADFAVSPQTPGWVRTSVLENGPFFSFERYEAPGIPSVCKFLDIGGGGSQDIVCAGFGGPSPQDGLAFLNDGHGHFSDATSSVFGGNPPATYHPAQRDLAIADFNGDGLMDVFVGDTGEEAFGIAGTQSRILMQEPGNHMADETLTRIPIQNAFTHSVAAGDVDGDGDIDIYRGDICCGSPPQFLINDGTGHFTGDTTRVPPEITNLQRKFTSSLLLDFRGRGRPDLILGKHGNLDPRDAILLNDGTGHFTFAPDNAMPLRCGEAIYDTVSIASADFDGDGRPDLILSTYFNDGNVTSGCIQLLLNNGDGTFRDATDRIPAPDAGQEGWVDPVVPVDLNGDGWMDFLTRGSDNVPSRIYLNVAGRYFVDATDLLPMKGSLAAFEPGDVDNDGKSDLLVTEGVDAFFVLRQLKPASVDLFKPLKIVTPVEPPPVAPIQGRSH